MKMTKEELNYLTGIKEHLDQQLKVRLKEISNETDLEEKLKMKLKLMNWFDGYTACIVDITENIGVYDTEAFWKAFDEGIKNVYVYLEKAL